MIVFNSIGSQEAMRLVGEVLTIAERDGGKPVAVCVLDVRGVQLAAVCMDGASEANVRTARAKAKTVLEFQRDTRDFRFDENDEPKPEGQAWSDHNVINAIAINPEFSSFAGGVAIRTSSGSIIGAIAVSGRPELGDHVLAEDATERVVL